MLVLYLHGFRSSPSSFKARATAEAVARLRESLRGSGSALPEFACPPLPASPRAALDAAERVVRERAAGDWTRVALVGSSLGGFYATVLAQRDGRRCRAAVVNPGTAPWDALAAHVDAHRTAYHSEEVPFAFTAQDHAELVGLRDEFGAGPPSHPERFCVLVSERDELIDCRRTLAWYGDRARARVVRGSDHAMYDYGDHVDGVVRFLLQQEEPT